MGQDLFKTTGVTGTVSEQIDELFRGIRTHFAKLLKKVAEEDIQKAQLGLAHAYSRSQCATDVNRQDKPIIQVIALIEQLDKDVNTFCMRLKEWFSWHFPELSKIVNDNLIFTRLVKRFQSREAITEDVKEELAEILHDEEKAQQVIDAGKISMGQEMNEVDQL